MGHFREILQNGVQPAKEKKKLDALSLCLLEAATLPLLPNHDVITQKSSEANQNKDTYWISYIARWKKAAHKFMKSNKKTCDGGSSKDTLAIPETPHFN